jgi:hypothetical protein
MPGSLLQSLRDPHLIKLFFFRGRQQFPQNLKHFANIDLALRIFRFTMYALRLVVLVDCASLVPSMTDFIFDRKVTTFPSRKSRP